MSRKIIRLPRDISGVDVTVTPYLSIIDTPLFERLRDVKQLDYVYKLFPGATQNRFAHSVGTFDTTKELIRNIENNKPDFSFEPSEKTTLEVAALCHDIGHPPFSHATEQVLLGFGQPDHNAKALEFVERLRPEIESVDNVDFELLKEILKRENPLHEIILGMIGADKLDYVNRDAKRAAVHVKTDTNRIITYAYYDGKRYGVDSRAVAAVAYHLEAWLHLHFEVYLRKLSDLYKGLLRTAFYHAVKAGEIEPEEVWEMTDGELEAKLAQGGEKSRELYRRIRNRVPPKTFLTLKISGQEDSEERRGKPIYVHGLPEMDLTKLVSYFGDIENVMSFERRLEHELELDPRSATVAEMPHISRIRPEDVRLYSMDRGWTSLYSERPDSRKSVLLGATRAYACRFGVRPDLREKAYEQSDKVLELIDTLI